jgi:UDPglucose 6-dehydrogenase
LDVDQKKIDILNSGGVPIYEPGLKEMIARNKEAGRIVFSTDIAASVEHGEIQFIAVGTPPDEDGSADLKYVLAAAKNIAKHMTSFKVIIDKSTVPVGTSEKVSQAMQAELQTRGVSDIYFSVISNPEFLNEGAEVEDFMRPDRIVVGSDDNDYGRYAKDKIRKLYSPFNRHHERTFYMDVKSAELTKYAANSFLATKLSFMNEIAQLCELLGADVDMVRRGIGSDERIGKRFLFPGIGYGGSCFPKDVQALIKSSEEVDYDFRILKSVERVNENQKTHLIPKINRFFNNDLKGKHFALWGLAFKPNTDDIREAPSLYIIKALIESGATICAYDPEAMINVKLLLGESIFYSENPYDALKGANALIIATEWSEFRTPNFEQIESLLENKVIFDGRNLYSEKDFANSEIEYFSIGR